jgi:hypothetical protein
LGLSCPAGFEQAEEHDVGPYREPRADQGFAIRRQAVDGPVVAMVKVHKDAHRYGRATSAAFSGSAVFTLATTESYEDVNDACWCFELVMPSGRGPATAGKQSAPDQGLRRPGFVGMRLIG